MIQTNGRAKKGGEVGLNGESYKGGQFLPSSEKTVKGSISVRIPKGTGKKKVAPYVYESSPADDMLSIYDRVESWVSDNRRECQYIKGEGFSGLRLSTSADLCHNFTYDRPATPEFVSWVSGLVDRWNSGERWYPLSEDPYHYLNQK